MPSAPAAPVTASHEECTGLQRVPPGASTTRVADGAEETLFLTTSAPWCFGVRTATRVFALADPLPGHGRHAVWGVATDGATGRAVVLDDGRAALVYRLQDSGLQQLRTQSADPLEFPVGATTAAGHGVACNDRNGGVLIERATTRQRADGRVDVLWATVSFVDDAGVARVSAPEVRYASLPAGDERVAQAATSRCSAAPQRAVALHP